MHDDARMDERRRAGRSLSTANLKGFADVDDGADEAEEKEALRRRRAKSVFDLRKDDEERRDEGEAEGSKLKAIISFFRNLRPSKEKEADKVISLTAPARERREKEGEEKVSVGERYRLWREKKQKAKKDANEEEEEAEEKKRRKQQKAKSDKKKKKSKGRQALSSDDSDAAEEEEEEEEEEDSDRREHSDKNERDTLPRRNGSARSADRDTGSLSDLSLDSLQLPPEYSNRDLDHRIQAVKPSQEKGKGRAKAKKSARRQKEAEEAPEELDADSLRARKWSKERPPAQRASGGYFADVDARSIASDRTDRSDESADSGQSSNFSKFRRRFRSRKNSTIQEVEELNHSDHSGAGQPGHKGSEPEKQKKKKKKKAKKKDDKKQQANGDLFSFDDSDEDPEVIVEEMSSACRERRRSRPDQTSHENQTVHLTYLSSDSDDNEKIIVDRWKQNFIEEKKGFRFLRRGRKEKKNSAATRITPLTEGSDEHYRLHLPVLPDEPWDPVEYDPERHNEQPEEDDFISVEQLQNLLADPSEKGNVAVIDARDYSDFLQSRLVFAKHVTEFQNAEAQMVGDVCSTFTIFILYDANGRTLSLMDSPLSQVYDFLKSGSSRWRIYIVDGGHSLLQQTAPYLLSTSKKKQRYDLTPSSCEKGYLMWANSQDISLQKVTRVYGVSHVITFEGDTDAKVPSGVDSLLVKVDADSVKLYDHFEELLKFALLGRAEDQKPRRVLVVCNSADSRASAVVVAFAMFRHHWNLENAYHHIAIRRGSVDIGKNNIKALQKLEKKLFGKTLTKSVSKVKAKMMEKEKKRGKDDIDELEDGEASDILTARDSKEKEKEEKKKKKKKKKKSELSDSDLPQSVKDIAFPDPYDDNNNNNEKIGERKEKKGKKSSQTLELCEDSVSLASSSASNQQTFRHRRSVEEPRTPPVPKRREKKKSIAALKDREDSEKEDHDFDDQEALKKKKKTKSNPKKAKKSDQRNGDVVMEFTLENSSESEAEEQQSKPKPKKRSSLFRAKRSQTQEAGDSS